MLPLAVISNLFTGDGLIIFLILLLLFGAKKLPELAKGLGSAVREFSKAKDEIHHEMTRPSDPPPRIEAPRYTEPHLAAGTDAPQAATVPAPETVQVASAAAGAGVGPSPSQAQPVGVTEPLPPTTEEYHHSTPSQPV